MKGPENKRERPKENEKRLSYGQNAAKEDKAVYVIILQKLTWEFSQNRNVSFGISKGLTNDVFRKIDVIIKWLRPRQTSGGVHL